MTDEAPRRGLAGIVVLLVAAAGAIAIAWLPGASRAPRAGVARDTTPSAGAPVPATAQRPDSDLAAPVVVERAQGASPFDRATTDSAVASCIAAVHEASLTNDSVVVEANFGDVDPTKGRADSLIVEGRVGNLGVWHCASTRRGDGAVAGRFVTVERIWAGVKPSFATNHALTVAAVESCLRRTKRIFREHEFRGLRTEQRGDSLVVSGDAIPLDNDLVRSFSCTAAISGGRVVAASARAVE